MQILVKALTGRTFELDVDASDTISDVKLMIEDKVNVSAEDQKLIFQQEELNDSRNLSDYNIQEGK